MDLFVILLVTFSLGECQLPSINKKNNVCRTLWDYAVRDISPNCWYNPDVGSSPEEIINNHGYPFESHQITTEDGYMLDLMRIPQDGKPPAMLVHGITTSSLTWLSTDNESLAFKLYNCGLDVWVINYRGTYPSRGHVNPNITDEEYWDFSWYELGYYDLPASINFIKEKTQQKILYFGHSMGTTTSYVYSILRKEEANNNLKALISIAPVAFMQDLILQLSVLAKFAPEIQTLGNMLKISRIGYTDSDERTQYFEACLFGFRSSICDFFVYFSKAFFGNTLHPQALPQYVTTAPQGTSLKSLEHYAQEINADGNFQGYDYGTEGNLLKYGTPKPPQFNVSEISIPVYLFYGKKDTLATEKNVQRLYRELTTEKYITAIAQNGDPEYNHFDFILGIDIKPFYAPLFRIISEIVPTLCE